MTDPFIEEIANRIREALNPLELSIRDFSAEHAGHYHDAHKHPAGTHIEISIRSELFDGKSRVQRQRMVHEIFKDELSSARIHALVLILKGSDEGSA